MAKKKPVAARGAARPNQKRAPAKPKAIKAGRPRPPAPDVAQADPTLFAPLTEGERADALRLVLDDPRLRSLAKIGRYRVISAEPLVIKPPDALATRRIARVVVYDHAGGRCLDAAVDLEAGGVCALHTSEAQPNLSPEEEAYAMAVALGEPQVATRAAGGSIVVQGVMHTWSRRPADLAWSRRSAAVLLGKPAARPSLVVVVDLSDGVVTDVVSAEKW